MLWYYSIIYYIMILKWGLCNSPSLILSLTHMHTQTGTNTRQQLDIITKMLGGVQQKEIDRKSQGTWTLSLALEVVAWCSYKLLFVIFSSTCLSDPAYLTQWVYHHFIPLTWACNAKDIPRVLNVHSFVLPFSGAAFANWNRIRPTWKSA